MNKIRLGINIDHVATLRNNRGGDFPDPIEIVRLMRKNDLDIHSITVHLREDRRHIRDADVYRLKAEGIYPINLEMAPSEEMLQIALNVKPEYVCLVPEKRAELTTEGGLDILSHQEKLEKYIGNLSQAGIKTSLFIEPDKAQIIVAKNIKADAVEIHTGIYSSSEGKNKKIELERIKNASALVKELVLGCHAGHGLNYENVVEIAKIKEIEELNIGHFLISMALYEGILVAIDKMRKLIDQVRHG